MGGLRAWKPGRQVVSGGRLCAGDSGVGGAAFGVRVLPEGRYAGHDARKKRERECSEVLVGRRDDHADAFMALPHSGQNFAERTTCAPQPHVACVVCINSFWRM